MIVRNCQKCHLRFSSYPSDNRRFCSMSCGRKGATKKHGQSKTRLHALWCSMKSRCRKSCPASKYYFNRGISVCDEWKRSFIAFREWALSKGYRDDLELDRIDNDKGYCPENCRWATRFQQMFNRAKRKTKCTSTFKGVSWCSNVNKWRVQIQSRGIAKHVGLFTNELEAAKAYDIEAVKAFGEFASLNFKKGERQS